MSGRAPKRPSFAEPALTAERRDTHDDPHAPIPAVAIGYPLGLDRTVTAGATRWPPGSPPPARKCATSFRAGRSTLQRSKTRGQRGLNGQPAGIAFNRGIGSLLDTPGLETDANPLAPALYHADRHALVPRIDDLRSRTKLKGKPTPEQLEELKAIKEEQQPLEAEFATLSERVKELLDRSPGTNLGVDFLPGALGDQGGG